MPLHADFENKYLVCDVSSYRLNSASQNYTDLHCRSFDTNPTLKVSLCAIVISKYWHDAMNCMMKTAALYFSTNKHSQFYEALKANPSI